ncbi:conserved hypothetical protein [Carnobacterium maltaromaticum]|uniref:hypothetical protein n=1 Tax=Carnobacterium maltaromaticum TaxID=2751 RepID=UPI00191BADCC|nr:hypothetical protein [Carnobacterium maltaromaticum]CAD5902610.1 conserved hypothetical protein [Carnobacterium maltaromaticum]
MLKKLALISLLTVFCIFIISYGKHSTKINDNSPYEIKQINGLTLKIKKIIELPKTKETEHKLLKITIEGSNTSPNPQSFDAMQVTVKNSANKSLDIYPSDSFGEMLGSGKTAEGEVFFSIEGKVLPAKVLYENPDTQEKIEWEIKSIQKDDK